MKKTIALFILLTSTAFAANPIAKNDDTEIQMSCINEFPSTSFIMSQVGTAVVMDVLHHNGVQYTPFRNSVITPSDIGMLSKQAETILKLAPNLRIKWKREGCTVEGPTFFECFGATEDITVNGLKLHPGYFSITDVTEKIVGGMTFNKKNVTFSFQIDGQDYMITNEFYGDECQAIHSTKK